ncbi:putative long-chain-alcohol O-fatty-acyltransferase 4 [Raphanus sativus]|uniref:Probable long-chain-alcohol O-fatty-acyltransferase 4 n=1 Tax=Raphanus sativus TaxID=3726 RepID=A0A6J0MXJ9_RAPSA|nr:probable long-chain-alcohol O-fatty-acyltransferase 4 [Raphanus sativus]KAJ4907657.1 putative long-chain-alcohol O-fatty-acyltransferase 4 [Raphanus sativus]
MEEQLKTLIKVWVFAIMCMSYCYYLPSKIKAGLPRLLFVLPICALFVVLPLFLSSIHLSGSTALFFSGVGNLKLILFCFDQGPLYPLPSNLFRFVCYTCFPVKLEQSPKSQTRLPKWLFAVKVALFGVVLHSYNYKQTLSPFLTLWLHPLHIYLELEVLLTLLKVFVTITLGCEVEPQFNEPYLATSLQDFWGRRWNLMVSSVLRLGVYYPVRRVCEYLTSSDYAKLIGVFATFLVSGVAHEVIFFYLTREMPTWEITLFFVLHGVCAATEMAVKRTEFAWRYAVSPMVSRLLTVGFVVVTSGWLFFPQLIRSGVMERRANEMLLVIDFVKTQVFHFL